MIFDTSFENFLTMNFDTSFEKIPIMIFDTSFENFRSWLRIFQNLCAM
jgi:hypothetical protein